MVLIENESETIHITGMGYAIGHYAHWIGKGAVRLEATSSNPLMQVTAFRNEDQRRLVLVVINNADEETSLSISLDGLTTRANIRGEQSTRDAYWQPLSQMNTDSPTDVSITVPAESVTSIVADL